MNWEDVPSEIRELIVGHLDEKGLAALAGTCNDNSDLCLDQLEKLKESLSKSKSRYYATLALILYKKEIVTVKGNNGETLTVSLYHHFNDRKGIPGRLSEILRENPNLTGFMSREVSCSDLVRGYFGDIKGYITDGEGSYRAIEDEMISTRYMFSNVQELLVLLARFLPKEGPIELVDNNYEKGNIYYELALEEIFLSDDIDTLPCAASLIKGDFKFD